MRLLNVQLQEFHSVPRSGRIFQSHKENNGVSGVIESLSLSLRFPSHLSLAEPPHHVLEGAHMMRVLSSPSDLSGSPEQESVRLESSAVLDAKAKP
jgi:hypothetical protein